LGCTQAMQVITLVGMGREPSILTNIFSRSGFHWWNSFVWTLPDKTWGRRSVMVGQRRWGHGGNVCMTPPPPPRARWNKCGVAMRELGRRAGCVKCCIHTLLYRLANCCSSTAALHTNSGLNPPGQSPLYPHMPQWLLHGTRLTVFNSQLLHPGCLIDECVCGYVFAPVCHVLQANPQWALTLARQSVCCVVSRCGWRSGCGRRSSGEWCCRRLPQHPTVE
jgi:hypothetical protein